MGTHCSSTKGELAAYTVGVSSDVELYFHLREHLKRLSENFDSEYLVGYGVGFYRGREFRLKMIEHRSSLDHSKYSFEEDLDSILYLHHKQGLYLKFFIEEKNIIAHISNWHETKLSPQLTTSALEALDDGKTLTALSLISAYYESNYNLHGFVWAKKLFDSFVLLNRKRREKKNTPEDELEKKRIAEIVRTWINNS
jgi:hypothetical protein